jgi:hypothetical protein
LNCRNQTGEKCEECENGYKLGNYFKKKMVDFVTIKLRIAKYKNKEIA